MFDILMGRYHWTMDYLLWGISYTNVQMLLSDTVQVCYTDMGPTDSRQVISADDPANAGLIRRIINEKE
jgi:hypothetical protein